MAIRRELRPPPVSKAAHATAPVCSSSSMAESISPDERHRILRGLPSSIRALLSRSSRSLSLSELRSLPFATPEQRCEALRLLFEGKNADDVIGFLIRRTRQNGSGKRTNNNNNNHNNRKSRDCTPPTRAATVERDAVKMNLSPSSSRPPPPPPAELQSHHHPLLTAPIETPLFFLSPSDRSFSPPIRLPMGPLVELSVNTSTGTGEAPNKHVAQPPSSLAFSRTPRPIATPPPPPLTLFVNHKNKTPADNKNCAKTSNNKKKMNIAMDAAAIAAPGSPLSEHHSSPPSSCAAWDSRYRTYIVHPNQLRRLEELGQRNCAAEVPVALRFSRQNTATSEGLLRRLPSGGPITRTLSSYNPILPEREREREQREREQREREQREREEREREQRERKREQREREQKPRGMPVIPPIKVAAAKKKMHSNTDNVFTRLYSATTARQRQTRVDYCQTSRRFSSPPSFFSRVHTPRTARLPERLQRTATTATTDRYNSFAEHRRPFTQRGGRRTLVNGTLSEQLPLRTPRGSGSTAGSLTGEKGGNKKRTANPLMRSATHTFLV